MDKPTNDGWQKVREIFDAALREPAEGRDQFVQQACSGDASLKAEVESLLASHDSAENFLETPAAIQVAENILTPEGQLSRAQILGDYEIQELIGTGGMGEVYLARDTRLDRKVAIKLLRATFLPDAQANRRLLREARAAALLEHPNICQIYQIGETTNHGYIVMQYIVGTTLADTLAKGPLVVLHALEIAIQIAGGLAEAHAHGIIHRDIKPANIIVNEKGQPKILDFGLAKFIEAETGAEMAQRPDSSGSVMGTVPFMSPEQLRGKVVDERTDIFSFGALFYEMLTGQPAFSRENNAETISAILNDDPAWSAVPSPLRDILRKCLAKSKDHRYESSQQLVEDLRMAQENGEFDRLGHSYSTTAEAGTPGTDGDGRKKRQFYFWQSSDVQMPSAAGIRPAGHDKRETTRRRRLTSFAIPAAFLTLLAAALAVPFVTQIYKNSDSKSGLDSMRSVRLVQWRSGASSNDTDYRVSHDGKLVAYSSSKHGGDEVIYVKQTGDGEEIRVTKDEWRNVSPIWSPDDQRIAFVSIRQDQPGIYVSPSLGGASTAFKVTDRTNLTLRHWSKDGMTIFYEQTGNLHRLDLTTRETEKVTDLPESSSGNNRHFSFSPDEERIVFCDDRDGQRDIWIMPVGGGEPVRLTNNEDEEHRPIWHPDGTRVLYNVVRNDSYQIEFAHTDGRPPVEVTRGEGSYELIGLSPDGSRIYYTSWEKRSDISAVNVETGEEAETAAGIETELWPDVSPDGNSVVYQMNASTNPTKRMKESVLIVNRIGGESTPVVRGGFNPRWLPDGRRIAFLRWDPVQRRNQLWLVDTINAEEKLLSTDSVEPPSYGSMPIARSDIGEFDVSPDGERFVFLDSERPRNVRLGSFDSSETVSLTDTQTPDVRYSSPLFLPDGKTIVCISVRRFPDAARKSESSIVLFQGDKLRLVPMPRDLRLVGWSKSGTELILETGDRLMKTGPRDLELIGVSLSGRSRIITAMREVYADTMTLSPDSMAVAFVARRNDKDDVWTMSLTSRDVKKVTNNGNTRVFYSNLSWVPDGKTIYFDKQEQVNTISMFENFN